MSPRRTINGMVAGVVTFAVLLGQPESGRLHGRVLDPSAAVITNTLVTVTSEAGRRAEAKTDRQGVYTFAGLAPGTYSITVAAPGFEDAHERVTIVAGSDLIVDIRLAIAIQRHEIVVQGDADRIATDPAGNATATVIKDRSLDALSDDPDELEAQLHALAGPVAGGGGGQIYVDGFTGGKLPPKSAIREIRLNLNPYSAEFDALGQGRIEIITKSGARATHGRFLLDGNDAFLNARNPYVPDKPDHRYSLFGGTVNGPLWSDASFVVAVQMESRHDLSAVHAVTLDPSLNPMVVNQAIAAPRTLVQVNPRIDFQATPSHTISFRYRLDDDVERGTGVGQLSLASQALDVHKTEHDVQASDLQVLGAALLNDVRFEYRANDVVRITRSADPQITVLGAFTGGGSSGGAGHASQGHFEVHDYMSASLGAQMLRVGGRLRITGASDRTLQNFNGTFTFSSLEAFQITERGLQQGRTPPRIRAAGGGASQFSIIIGDPLVSDTMFDVGLFVQDDWRLRPNLTLSGGIRYETQNEIRVRANLAPRAGMAWSIGRPGRSGSRSWVVRSGVGLFYERFPQALVLQAERLDGLHTQQFIVESPDFFPTLHSGVELSAAEIMPTVYRIDPGLRAPTTLQTGITLERKLGKASTLAVGYGYSHASNQLLSRNIDAPHPGEQTNRAPLYEFESQGTFRQNQLTTNFTLRPAPWVSFNGYYALTFARADTSGPMSFPSTPFDLRADDGRASFDTRHRFVMFAGFDLPGFRVVPFIAATSGQPFDITVGRDLNGDSIFNDRPAFATDLSRPTVVVTRFGTFDTAPIAGQTIIPHNFGTGPAQFSVNLRVMKPFVIHEHDTIRVDLVASNLFNRVNAGMPVGNLSSPLFGQSIGLSNVLSASANRQVHVQLQFLF